MPMMRERSSSVSVPYPSIDMLVNPSDDEVELQELEDEDDEEVSDWDESDDCISESFMSKSRAILELWDICSRSSAACRIS